MSPPPLTASDVQRLLSRLQLSSSDDVSSHAEGTLSKFTNPTHISSLPTPSAPSHSSSPRLLVIGDVHGQLRSLQSLLTEAGYSRERGDRVVLTGDMINKGADSPGVVALAMSEGFASVRGNHEDRVLRLFALAEAMRAERGGDEGLRDWEEALPKGDRVALATARSLSPEQRAWVAELPLILRVGTVIPRSPGGGGEQELLVVHAGLVPGLPLEDQDPWAVMNMRTLLFPDEKKNGKLSTEDRAVFEESVRKKLKDQNPNTTPTDEEFVAEAGRTLDHYAVDPQRTTNKDKDTTPVSVPVNTREGRSWAKVWNEAQQRRQHRDGAKSMTTMVAYGHDARRGLNIKEFTFGLDSGCVKGGRLTALVFEPDDEGRGVRLRLASVACDAAERPGKDKDKDKKEKKDKERKSKDGKMEDKD
ncbi:hypothetical protein DL771_007598 [Monosporascus sp. 5C6A]|nr:hypothetical protein DL771_007598 [Monosporascus sp. 5C6A]